MRHAMGASTFLRECRHTIALSWDEVRASAATVAAAASVVFDAPKSKCESDPRASALQNMAHALAPWPSDQNGAPPSRPGESRAGESVDPPQTEPALAGLIPPLHGGRRAPWSRHTWGPAHLSRARSLALFRGQPSSAAAHSAARWARDGWRVCVAARGCAARLQPRGAAQHPCRRAGWRRPGGLDRSDRAAPEHLSRRRRRAAARQEHRHHAAARGAPRLCGAAPLDAFSRRPATWSAGWPGCCTSRVAVDSPAAAALHIRCSLAERGCANSWRSEWRPARCRQPLGF